MADATLFVGTWKLISWEIRQPDGTIRYPYGKDVVGYLIYTADGYISAELTGKLPERTDPASQNHLTLLQGIATEAKMLLGRKGAE